MNGLLVVAPERRRLVDNTRAAVGSDVGVLQNPSIFNAKLIILNAQFIMFTPTLTRFAAYHADAEGLRIVLREIIKQRLVPVSIAKSEQKLSKSGAKVEQK